MQLRLGFKVDQQVGSYLHQVVAELVESGQIEPQHHKYSIFRTKSAIGDFRYCLIRKVINSDTGLAARDYHVMKLKYAIRGLCGSPVRWYGLGSSSVIVEYVPLFSKKKAQEKLTRIAMVEDDPGAHGPLEKLEVAHADASADAGADVDGEDDIFSVDTRGDRESNRARAGSDLVGGDTASFDPVKPGHKEED